MREILNCVTEFHVSAKDRLKVSTSSRGASPT